MVQAAVKKVKIERDRFTDDGVRMFNPSKDHGVVYADGFIETKFIQEYEGRQMHYRGDGTPVGYVPGQPLPQPVDAVEAENEALKARIRDLEAATAKTNAMLEQLLAQKEAPKGESKAVPSPEATPAQQEAPASGARRIK